MNDEKIQEYRQVAKSIVGLTLAHAFVTVKSHHLDFRVRRLDDETYHGIIPVKENTVSVFVRDGIVTRSWLGTSEERNK